MSRARRAALLASACAVMAAASVTGCASNAPASPGTGEEPLRVVATTGILADIVRNVAGEDAHVTTLIPDGRDPHSFEPSLRTTREVAHAKVQFANGLLLEPQNLMDMMREVGSAPVVEVADRASTTGAELVPLVENVALDAVWLGLRIVGSESQEPVTVRLDKATGPGDVAAYVISTFGTPTPLFNTADGLSSSDSTTLPANAHTHVSWAFSAPGIYELTFSSGADERDGQPASVPITIAVGVNPPAGKQVIDSGHVDIAFNQAPEQARVTLQDQGQTFDPATTVLAVPSSTYQPIPADPAYRFLGVPGQETYLLPQAVLGKHVHGEVDPHLWHNVRNVIAYVDVIAEELANADPSHGHHYRERAAAYQDELRALHGELTRTYEDIPPQRRQLVTTHHGYAYLEQGYGIKAAGFVTPNLGVEPSPRDVGQLQRTLRNLKVPAVFIEPQAQPTAATLQQEARAQNVAVCTIYGDTLDHNVSTYDQLMRHNARELHRCLTAPERNS